MHSIGDFGHDEERRREEERNLSVSFWLSNGKGTTRLTAMGFDGCGHFPRQICVGRPIGSTSRTRQSFKVSTLF